MTRRWAMARMAFMALTLLVGHRIGAAADASPLTGELKAIDGSVIDLASLKGKVVLVVNVASRCGATPQYAGLQKLYDTHKDRGLVVLGVPSNDFGGQEPGSDEQIAGFCTSTYGVTFPMASKVRVTGPDKAPLFASLITASDDGGEVAWNFEKFLVGRDGRVIGRFRTRTKPDDASLVEAIEAALTAAP